ncbi:hypothetical protein F4677DRAFT_439828 [Hypoxylon crocopeplum]|nr:hypothetical protein F4677DRAFT_439828 [Hypoxylon crocopeplum]
MSGRNTDFRRVKTPGVVEPPYNQEELNDQTRRMIGVRRDWYGLDIEPEYDTALYQPEGRWLRVARHPTVGEDILTFDWYNRFGIPHEVSLPNSPHGFISFRLWMVQVARAWSKPVRAAGLNPDLFGGIYDQGRINFFQVMRFRIARQRAYAFYVGLAWYKQQCVLTTRPGNMDIFGEYTPEGPIEMQILFSLVGLDFNFIHVSTEEIERLKRFIRSPAVRTTFIEYATDYLETNENTTIPRWNIIQPSLSNPDLAASRAAAYGRTWEDSSRLNKTHWSHEDHAIRFILTLYEAATRQLEYDDIGTWNARSFERFFFSTASAPDMADRHWFGYSLLNLLLLSWQYNQVVAWDNYPAVLVPALYEGFRPARIRYPRPNLGEIDLSPHTPWIWFDDYVPTMDLQTAVTLGLIEPATADQLNAQESPTEMTDDGRIRPEEVQPGWRPELDTIPFFPLG